MNNRSSIDFHWLSLTRIRIRCEEKGRIDSDTNKDRSHMTCEYKKKPIDLKRPMGFEIYLNALECVSRSFTYYDPLGFHQTIVLDSNDIHAIIQWLIECQRT